jgi:hypothetical protein
VASGGNIDASDRNEMSTPAVVLPSKSAKVLVPPPLATSSRTRRRASCRALGSIEAQSGETMFTLCPRPRSALLSAPADSARVEEPW